VTEDASSCNRFRVPLPAYALPLIVPRVTARVIGFDQSLGYTNRLDENLYLGFHEIIHCTKTHRMKLNPVFCPIYIERNLSPKVATGFGYELSGMDLGLRLQSGGCEGSAPRPNRGM